MDPPYTQPTDEAMEASTESATETDSEYREESLDTDDHLAMTEAEKLAWRAKRGKAKAEDSPEPELHKRKRVIESPEPRKTRAIAVLDDDEWRPPRDHKPTSSARKVVISLDSDDEDTDPVAAHMTMVRVNTILKSESEATAHATTALTVMTECKRNLLSGSALDKVALMPVRQTLRGLLNLNTSMTSKATRRAARALISLDRKIEENLTTIVAALDANVLVRDARHERFLREHKCPLCRKSFPDPVTHKLSVLRFNCDHAVHVACMSEWQRAATPAVTARCPFCRESAWGDDLDDDDLEALESDPDDLCSSDDDGAFRASTSSEPVTGVRVTRAMGRENERHGRSQYAEPR